MKLLMKYLGSYQSSIVFLSYCGSGYMWVFDCDIPDFLQYDLNVDLWPLQSEICLQYQVKSNSVKVVLAYFYSMWALTELQIIWPGHLYYVSGAMEIWHVECL